MKVEESTQVVKPEPNSSVSSTEKPSKITRTKVIKTPGSKIERIAQACDRCRLKKTKCDGKRPQCSQCELVGFECKVSDKLSRLSYPRGYTETLEQRVRELETENRKLLSLLDLRNEPNPVNNNNNTNEEEAHHHETQISAPIPSENGATQRLSSSNLHLLNKQTSALTESHHFEHLGHSKHIHSGPGCCANYPHSVHETPVSIAGSVDLEQSDDQDSIYSFNNNNNDFDSINTPYNGKQNHLPHHLHHHTNMYNVSFEQNQAPGLNAALAIARMNNLRKSNIINANNGSSNGNGNVNNNGVANSKLQLANLVAMSIPRSTEEMLFIPSLLSKIGETYGLNSKVCFLTANTIASLKQIPKSNLAEDTSNVVGGSTGVNFNSLNFKNITIAESNLFFNSLKLPSKIQLDQLVTIYFQEWGVFMPLIDKSEFLNQYATFLKSMESNFHDNSMMKNERFGLSLILMCQLSLISLRNSDKLGEQDLQLINYFDGLIHKLIQTSLTEVCSIQSLQILTLTLYYSLNTGDVITSYQLRGKVITMAQQLRLHRCPSAVLGTNGSTVSKFQQGERRILFWCIYTLDVFSSLQLGVPRLLKDYEIECALPMGIDSEEAEDEANNFIIVNNSKISLVGKVFKFSLSIMRYSKVLGNILDSIFRRHSSTNDNKTSNHDLILIHENLLDSWRRDLPKMYQFQIEVNGSFKMGDGSEALDFKRIVLVLLYYSAKMLIHLPVIANEVEKSSRSSSIVIQQCSINILKLLQSASSQFEYQLPLPINVSRLKTRLILLSAKGSLEYTRGGAIFQDIKKLLGTLLTDLKTENYDRNSPGNLSNSCILLLESSVELILGGTSTGTSTNNTGTIPKDVKRSTSLSSKTGSQSSRKRNISNVNDQPVSESHYQEIQPKTDSPDQNELTQMLSQINSIPPIIKPGVNIINSRVPHTNRLRSTSVSSSSHQQPNTENFDFQFNMNEFNFKFNNDENYEFAEFGADGSLGLEPWLNNLQDSNTTKSITPPFDFNMPDATNDLNQANKNSSSSSYGLDPQNGLENLDINNNINTIFGLNTGTGGSIADSTASIRSLKSDITGGSFYSNYSHNTPTPPPHHLQQQHLNGLQQHLPSKLLSFQQQQQQQVKPASSNSSSGNSNLLRGNNSLAATSVKNQHQSLFDWQNS